MKTKVVHCRRSKYDVYIGRPGKWGNPFRLEPGDCREEVLDKYRLWIMKQRKLLSEVHELAGKTLGCWCKPLCCHGDVLAELADAAAKEGKRRQQIDKRGRTRRASA